MNNQGSIKTDKGCVGLQDSFLDSLRLAEVQASIYLVNGIKLQGSIVAFDQYVVMLRGQVTQMVYKHAISTIVPSLNVNFDFNEEAKS